MKGVAYQQGINTNTTQSVDSTLKIVDPLADSTACKRDIEYLKKVQTNTIRVYAIDPSKDHKTCMNALADAGIYVIADLSEPGNSIIRDDPGWTTKTYERYTSVVDELMKYDNTLGFFAGNEVSNQPNNTMASAFVKAAVRDTKAYIKSKNYREIGVGYATNDDADIRSNLAAYFDCGDKETAIDFWGYNIYSWCGDSSFSESGFDVRTKEFEKYNVPVFFAEYGCNTPRPRLFTEVGALYGKQMTGVWSGGIVYMYFEEENMFGKHPQTTHSNTTANNSRSRICQRRQGHHQQGFRQPPEGDLQGQPLRRKDGRLHPLQHRRRHLPQGHRWKVGSAIQPSPRSPQRAALLLHVRNPQLRRRRLHGREGLRRHVWLHLRREERQVLRRHQQERDCRPLRRIQHVR